MEGTNGGSPRAHGNVTRPIYAAGGTASTVPVPSPLRATLPNLAAFADDRRVMNDSDPLVAAVRRHGRTARFAEPASEDERYLDLMAADGNVGGERMTRILLRRGCSRAVLWEELLHGVQFRLGLFDRLGVAGCERHVKRFMLRHRRLLALSPAEAATLEDLIARGL